MVGHLHCEGANYSKHMSICSRATANNCFNLLFILLMGGRCKIQFTCRVNMNENNWLSRRVSLMYIWSHLLLTFWEFTQSDATFLYHSPNFSDFHYANSCITSHLTCMLSSLILWNNSLLLSSSYSSEHEYPRCLTEGGFVSEVLLLADLQMLDWGYFTQICENNVVVALVLVSFFKVSLLWKGQMAF